MTIYVVIVYAVGLSVLWGYAGCLWLQSRTTQRPSRTHQGGQS
jgi:hypothetical protein